MKLEMIIMKSAITLFVVCLVSSFSFTQTLITPFAASSSNGAQTVCHSGGEPVIVTVLGNTNLTQGFQQPENLEKIEVYLPSVFSPNSNSGDTKFIIGLPEEAPVYINRFLIFDRWGNIVYEQADVDPHTFEGWWDGTFDGKTLVNGVYTYMIDYNVRSKALIAKGSLTKL